MSAAPKSYIPVPVPSKTKPRRSIGKTPSRPAPTVSLTPRPRPKGLSLLQKAVSLVTFSLLGSTLGIYAWTVYIPKVWDKEFGKLEALQRHERDLLATNETIKHQLARQAEKPETGFTAPRPFQTIFLRRSPDARVKPVTVTRPETAELFSRKAY